MTEVVREDAHSRSAIVIGLGSPQGDDQVGWAAVDRLRPRLPAAVVAVKAAGGLDLLASLVGQDEVIVVDAAAPADRPGTIRWFGWPSPELLDRVPASSHGLGLIEALRLAETLGRLPRRVRIATVEADAGATAAGLGLSVAAERGLEALVQSLLEGFGPRDAAIPVETCRARFEWPDQRPGSPLGF